MVIHGYDSLNVCTQTDIQTDKPMQVWDKDTTLYQAILKPQTPLMLRNPGFLSFPARRRLFQGRGAATEGEAAERAGAI